MDCIFCRIVAGEIPSIKVYEDEAAIAIMDINPLTEGHLLVLPKVHAENLFDADETLVTEVVKAATRIAKSLQAVLKIEGLSVVQANGVSAFQSVPHLHFHLIPRRPDDGAGFDWKPRPGDMEAVQAVGERIAAALS